MLLTVMACSKTDCVCVGAGSGARACSAWPQKAMAALWFVLVTACTSLTAASETATVPASTSSAMRWQHSFIALEPDGGWDAPAAPPKTLQHDEAATWHPVDLPHARQRSLAQPGDTLQAPPEVVWYRFDVPQGLIGSDPFFYLPRWQTLGEIAVYADDRLVFRSQGSRVWNGFNRPVWVQLAQAAGGAAPGRVLLRMASQQGVGGALSTAWIGSEQALHWRYRLRTWLQVELVSITSGTFLMIGLFSLAVWFVRRRETIYALFFISAAAHALHMLQFTTGGQASLLPDALFGWLVVNAIGWTMACIYLFAMRVHNTRLRWLDRGIFAAVAAMTLVTLPVWGIPLEAVLPVIYIVDSVLAVSIALAGLWASRQGGSRAGLVLYMWFALSVPAGLYDTFMASYRVSMESVYLTPYVSTGLFAIFLVIMYQRYVGALRQVETANTQLEVRLAERERELAASYQHLQAMEQQRALDAERQRMMQDMHDGIGSSLISALRVAESGRVQDGVMARVLRECIDDLKLSIDSLDHSGTDLLSVLAALRFRLAPRLQAAGLALHWRVVDVPELPWLDPKSALHILRILQEVLTNIVKHSAARSIEIATGSDGECVQVWVRDDGLPHRLADPGALSQRRGLANIRSRSEAIGARCEWRAAAQGGAEEPGMVNMFALLLPLQGGVSAAA